jgi:hypothetical protein
MPEPENAGRMYERCLIKEAIHKNRVNAHSKDIDPPFGPIASGFQDPFT